MAGKKRDLREFALYHGDEFVAIGTVAELAERQGVTEETIKWYGTQAAEKRVEGFHLVATGTLKSV